MTAAVYPAPGSSPGMLLHREGRTCYPSRLRLCWYDGQELSDIPDASLGQVAEYRLRGGITWLHLSGLQDLELLASVGDMFDLHRLALEDVLEGRAPIKVEDYPHYLFLVCRVVSAAADFADEQISLFVGRNFLVSIQETQVDHFAPIRQRLTSGAGQIQKLGTDYLMYALVDYMVDSWFPWLEDFGDRLEELEDRLLDRPAEVQIHELQRHRRLLLQARRLLWPLREVVHSLLNQERQLIQASTRVYLRDCADHAFQIIDLMENYRDMASSLVEVYLSAVNNRLNEIMKVLTIIATIFMPLTFIAGVYGMNFKTEVSPYNMPELSWYFGYPFSLALMAVTVLLMLLFFRSRKWL